MLEAIRERFAYLGDRAKEAIFPTKYHCTVPLELINLRESKIEDRLFVGCEVVLQDISSETNYRLKIENRKSRHSKGGFGPAQADVYISGENGDFKQLWWFIWTLLNKIPSPYQAGRKHEEYTAPAIEIDARLSQKDVGVLLQRLEEQGWEVLGGHVLYGPFTREELRDQNIPEERIRIEN